MESLTLHFAVGERGESDGARRWPSSFWGGDRQCNPQRPNYALQDHHRCQQHSDSGDSSSRNHPTHGRPHKVTSSFLSNWNSDFIPKHQLIWVLASLKQTSFGLLQITYLKLFVVFNKVPPTLPLYSRIKRKSYNTSVYLFQFLCFAIIGK